jgi:hypothetical protein
MGSWQSPLADLTVTPRTARDGKSTTPRCFNPRIVNDFLHPTLVNGVFSPHAVNRQLLSGLGAEI